MFEKFKNFFVKQEAATQLAPVAPLKVKPGQRSLPAFFTSTKPSKEKVPQSDRRLINADVPTYRNGTSTTKVLQDMAAASPELSSAIWTSIRLGVPKKFCAIARDMDGKVNPAATALLQQLIARFDCIGDPSEGYTGNGSLRSISETMAGDLITFGQCAAELVLGKDRLPYRIQPISSTVIQYRFDGNGVRPFQEVSGEEFDLDIPTVAIVQLDQKGLSPYPTSPLETALRPVLFAETFQQDVHRVMRRATHPRMTVKVDEEKVRKNFLSPEAQLDSSKANEEMNAIISQIEQRINNLDPSDALVYLNMIDVAAETPPSVDGNYDILRSIANAKVASGSKTLPSVIGLETGSASSNISSTEANLYIRSVETSITRKLDEIISRLFTIALRLFGLDVYAVFEYEPVNIRPDSELAAFRQTQQMMTLELLNYGFIGDEEASLMLTGKLPPAGFKPLSGTRFKDAAKTQAPDDNPNGESNSGDTYVQKSKSDQPAVARGQNKKASTDEQPIQEAQQPTFVTPDITLNIDNTQKSASILRMHRNEDGDLIIERASDAA